MGLWLWVCGFGFVAMGFRSGFRHSGSRHSGSRRLGSRLRTYDKCGNGRKRANAHVRVIERAFHETVQSRDSTASANRHQFNFACVARLESHGCPCGNVEPHAVGRRAIEVQQAIDLEEVTVRSDLHGSIATIADLETHGAPSGVDFDRIGGKEILSGNHV